jgi:hypothetical protein
MNTAEQQRQRGWPVEDPVLFVWLSLRFSRLTLNRFDVLILVTDRESEYV